MNELQKIINEMEDEVSTAKELSEWHYRRLEYKLSDEFSTKAVAVEKYIQKLKLLLKDESKQPQPPDFANTMLGEVPHEVNAQSEECLQAVEGATPVVRQNEQTKKDGGHEFQIYGDWPPAI